MQHSIYFKKALWLKGAMMLVAIFSIIAFSACSDDDEPSSTPAPEAFSGSLSTSIPSMPNFEAVTSDVDAKITWLNPEQTLATLSIGAFTIETGVEGRGYAIGAMEITGIDCSKASNGTIAFSNDSFTCQAGEYATSGSVEGQYADGQLTFTMLYRPGTMPFDVKSVFTTK